MKYRLGLDIGIASVGWAVIRHDKDGQPNGIENCGVRLFEKAEKPDSGESLSLERRIARGARRRIRRHQHRKLRAKQLIENYGLMTQSEIEEMYSKKLNDIYEIRVQALERLLSREEWARLLILWLQRRGYKSNSKSEEKDADNKKTLGAISENKRLIAEKGYRTVGEMIAKDEKFRVINCDSSQGFIRKTRNSSGDYKLTLARDLIENEIEIVFEKQNSFGNAFAKEEFKEKYFEIFRSQRKYDNGPALPSKYGGDLIEKMLGKCTFENEEPRAAIASYTFEYFRLLQDINNISIMSKGGDKYKLSQEEKSVLLAACKKSENINYKKVRDLLKLSDDLYFGSLSYGSKDYKEVEDKEKLKGMKAFHEIRRALDKVKKDAVSDFSESQLDAIAHALTIKKDTLDRITLFKKANIPYEYFDTLDELNFTKVGNLSIKALKKINQFLEQGHTYDKACELAGYDFRNQGKTERNKKFVISEVLKDFEVKNPVVKRSISQALKIINAIIEKYGSPDLICIELSRDMSNSYEERQKIEKSQKENRLKNEFAYNEVKKLKTKPTGEDVIKYRLWQEQHGICLYSGKSIHIETLFDKGYVDVDHIIPYSKSYDDSFSNKVLVFSNENRQKGNRLPIEYMKNDIAKLNKFTTLVENTIKNHNKKNKLLKEKLTTADREKFIERNLNDTKYATRLISNIIRKKLLFNESVYSKNPVLCVNGNMTAYIRKRFGLEKNRELSSRHHALDAIVIASASPRYIQVITLFNQAVESIYDGQSTLTDYETGEVFKKEDYIKEHINDLFLPLPWSRFRDEVIARLSDDPAKELERLKMPTINEYDNKLIQPIFISIKPARKITGKAHKDTIFSGRVSGNIIKKIPLNKLTLDKDNEIKNYYNKKSDIVLYELLKTKLISAKNSGDGKIQEDYVIKPKKDGTDGPVVKSVKVIEKSSSNLNVRDSGVASNGDMVRIDIFNVKDKGYYFVPVYVSDTIKKELPYKAAPFNIDRPMNDKDFLFSIYYNDLIYFESIEKQKFNGELRSTKEKITEEYDKGYFYFKTADISVGTLSINTDHNNLQARISINKLKTLKKCEVDLLGNISFVKSKEKRKAFKLQKEKDS